MLTLTTIQKVLSTYLTIINIALFLISCNQRNTVDFKTETEAILRLHNAQRNYHFNKDSIAFANQLSKNFISVNRGKVTTPQQSETISQYHGYFSSVEFLKWDDVTDPIIKFSDDGSMAYTIVDKIVSTTSTDEYGNLTEGQTHFAWTAIYKKYGDHWKIDCVTSTNKPVEE